MATTKHRHVGVSKIDECIACQDKMIEALESLGYRVTQDMEYECADCGEELKAIDTEWWHAGTQGDYRPASHSAAPVPKQAVA